MENHPIERWDQLVCQALYPAKLKNELADNGKPESYSEESKKLREEVRSYLIRETFSCKTEQGNRVLVEQHQGFFSNLMDLVYEYQAEDEIPVELQEIYGQVGKDMEAILWFLETSFPSYFNQNNKVPDFIRSKFEKGIRPQLEKAKKRLAEVERNQHLIETIFSIIDSYLASSVSEVVSFRQLNYLKSLVNEILNRDLDVYKDSKLSPAIELLMALKFNDGRFLQAVILALKEFIAAVDSEDEQFRLWKEYSKTTSQILESTNDRLFPDQPSPKDVILDWLSQEIYFLETCYPKKENSSAVIPASKINTSLSVPVLALYVRLFKEAGIITNSNYQELFRAVSSTFTTNRKAEVAHSHLHSKFYAIEESARRKVFDQLMSMVHMCKRIG